MSDLKRFIDAQQTDYATALQEITDGRKKSHWMWYIFPQIAGLGQSETSRHFAIRNRDEAEGFLNHPLLGQRLVEISTALLRHSGRTAYSIFGSPDDMKLKSSMTLFAELKDPNPIFQKVLDQFFNGEKDQLTLEILRRQAPN